MISSQPATATTAASPGSKAELEVPVPQQAAESNPTSAAPPWLGPALQVATALMGFLHWYLQQRRGRNGN
jgi:hypothetical protein